VAALRAVDGEDGQQANVNKGDKKKHRRSTTFSDRPRGVISGIPAGSPELNKPVCKLWLVGSEKIVSLEGRPCSSIIDPAGSSASSATNAQAGNGDDDKRGGVRLRLWFFCTGVRTGQSESEEDGRAPLSTSL
jgi:hypothetical protein